MLNAALKADLKTICRVLDDPLECLAYARDLWPLGHIEAQRGQPEGLGKRPYAVVCPRDEAQVAEVVRLAGQYGCPIIPWGEGSGVCGGTVAIRGGIALDMKQLCRIERIDRESLTVTVQSGINGHILEQSLEREGLTLGHSPSSILCSTVGGWLAARSAGQFSTLYGKIEDMVLSLRVVLADGRLVETVCSPRSAAGPDWNQIFIGSEGTLGIITAATLRLHRLPPTRSFLSYHVPGVKAGFDMIREIMQRGLRPAAVRLYDPLDTLLVGAGKDHEAIPADPILGPEWPLKNISFSAFGQLLTKRLPKFAEKLGKQTALSYPKLANSMADQVAQNCLLILTFEGLDSIVSASVRETQGLASLFKAKDLGPDAAETWWRNRHAVSFKQSEVFKMGAFSDTMEVATTWDRLETLYHTVRKALSPHAVVLAHFSHAYPEGANIYFSVAARCASPDEAKARYQALWRDGLKAVVECGAAVSHHHGIGLLKADALKASLGPLHDCLQSLKNALDPDNLLNPGKLGLD